MHFYTGTRPGSELRLRHLSGTAAAVYIQSPDAYSAVYQFVYLFPVQFSRLQNKYYSASRTLEPCLATKHLKPQSLKLSAKLVILQTAVDIAVFSIFGAIFLAYFWFTAYRRADADVVCRSNCLSRDCDSIRDADRGFLKADFRLEFLRSFWLLIVLSHESSTLIQSNRLQLRLLVAMQRFDLALIQYRVESMDATLIHQPAQQQPR